MSTDKMRVPCLQNTEETIAKYVVDANLFRQGSTNPKKKPASGSFLEGGEASHQEKKYSKCFQYLTIQHYFLLF